jgi:hypothetical protein
MCLFMKVTAKRRRRTPHRSVLNRFSLFNYFLYCTFYAIYPKSCTKYNFRQRPAAASLNTPFVYEWLVVINYPKGYWSKFRLPYGLHWYGFWFLVFTWAPSVLVTLHRWLFAVLVTLHRWLFAVLVTLHRWLFAVIVTLHRWMH